MSTQTKKKSSVSPPLPINKVFVSSTFTDMLPYREAIRSAIDRANCKAVGMERFGAASIPSLEKCLEELKTCQIYVCAIGMRYGSIDKESQMSYTQLEFRFLYKGIIIKHNKTEPTYTKTSLFLCEKRRFFMARTEKGVVTTI